MKDKSALFDKTLAENRAIKLKLSNFEAQIMIKDDGIDGVKTVHKGRVCNFGGQLVRSFSRSNAVDCSTTTVKNFHV